MLNRMKTFSFKDSYSKESKSSTETVNNYGRK